MRKTLVTLALLLASTLMSGCSMPARDYPSGDADALSQRLVTRAPWAYDGMGLPDSKSLLVGRVDVNHSCYDRGLTSIDEPAEDVVAFELSWAVENVPAQLAHATEARARDRFAAAGWKLTRGGNRRGTTFTEYGFRFEDPAAGDTFDVSWNDSTTTLFVSGYTPCAKVPSCVADSSMRDEWGPRA